MNSQPNQPRTFERVFFNCHVCAVAASTVVFGILLFVARDAQDASIGAGMAGALVGVLGLPWSIVALFAPSVILQVVTVAVSAWFNVLLHFMIVRRRLRRDGN